MGNVRTYSALQCFVAVRVAVCVAVCVAVRVAVCVVHLLGDREELVGHIWHYQHA